MALQHLYTRLRLEKRTGRNDAYIQVKVKYSNDRIQTEKLYLGQVFGDEFDPNAKGDAWYSGDDHARRNLLAREGLNKVEAIYLELCKHNEYPSAAEIKAKYRAKPEPPPLPKPIICLVQYFDQYVADKTLEPNSAKTYTTAQVALKDFLRIKKGMETEQTYPIRTVDSGFIYAFEHYLAKARSKTKGQVYSKGTATQYLGKLKAVLSHAFQMKEIEVDVSSQHQWTGLLKDGQVRADAIITEALMWKIPKEYLHKIENFPVSPKHIKEDEDLTGTNGINSYDLSRPRLLFLLQAFTGLAYADLADMRDVKLSIRNDMNGSRSLIYNRAKNGELAIVPLFEQTEKLLEKLNYDATPGCSYETFNRKIKALMRYYEVPTPPDEIGTHTGRHLFGTRMVHMGFNMAIISRMMGHTSMAITMKTYARVDLNGVNADWERVQMLQQPTGTKLAI
ncbi:MAG: phage integrase SAM-like domain-containing protein [Chryseolinea sp.]